MKKAKWFVSLFLLMVLVPVHGQAQAGFVDGNEFIQVMRAYEQSEREGGGKNSEVTFGEGYYLGYVTGVREASAFLFDIPSGVTAGQLAHVVAKYLKEHPKRWAEPALVLVIDAIREAFPQKKK